MSIRLPLLSLAVCLGLLAAVPAQSDPFAEGEVALAKKACTELMQFARMAHRKKVRTREREAYEMILREYDPDYGAARHALGYRRVKDTWQEPPPDSLKQWRDEADDKRRYDVIDAWSKLARSLGALHRERGIALLAEGDAHIVEANAHLERAVRLNPFDAEAHKALGHRSITIGDDEYWGTPEQLAFIQRMHDIETRALELAKRDYEVEPVDSVPAKLASTGLEFHGARTEHFLIFTRGTQKNADDCACWAERALAFFGYVAGERAGQRAMRAMKQWQWIGFLWTPKEREKFEAQNPELVQKKLRTANIIWHQGKGVVQVVVKPMPSAMQDFLIAHVFNYGLEGCNKQLREGVVHAATWLMKSTCMTRFTSAPEGTVGSAEKPLADSAAWWLREMRDQAIAGTDTPISTVPRVPFWNFNRNARLKAWSFMTWAMARYPDKWLRLVAKVPADKIPFPSEVEKIGAKVFGRPLPEVEAEWREWASGRSITAAATGYGPPLLPERPSDDELEGLARLNTVRSLARGAEPEKGGEAPALPPCELDAEATMACIDHAKFLGLHEEHHKWPEAHEEDPAKEGFTPRGMRAGLRSVIITSDGRIDVEKSIDMWIGTVYHRFPLLAYNVRRIGYAVRGGPAGEACVLDMDSLKEPRDPDHEKAYRWVVWPPDGMRNVPRTFSFTEQPNPLEDVGLGLDAQKDTGYPVSLQLSDSAVQNLAGGSISLFEGHGRGREVEKGDPVPCWVHTPDQPLLARMELRNVFFVIPKERLKPRTTYLAVVELPGLGRGKVQWSFTTGSQEHGLGRR